MRLAKYSEQDGLGLAKGYTIKSFCPPSAPASASPRSRVTAPIIGASKAIHLDDAIAELSPRLDADEIGTLEKHYVSHAVSGH